MRVLIACEFSGAVREAFARRGHTTYSCDLLPSEQPCTENSGHLQCDVLEILEGYLSEPWDLMVAHPPCTYLCSSGLHWNKRRPERAAQTEAALRFVQALLDAPIERIALENPVGCIGTRIRPADQYIQPHQFGADASKRTGLWLKGLAKLEPTSLVTPRIAPDGKPRWANQTDSGQNRLGPSDTRWAERSITYRGIAEAMAAQWGGVNECRA